MKRAKAWTALFFLGLFLLYALIPRTVGMGHASRLDLTKAIVHHGSFGIDDYVKNTIDWSYAGGHYYTNKAPGVSFLAVPFYWAMTKVEATFRQGDTDWSYRNLRWTDVFVTALSTALTALLLFLYGRKERGAWGATVVFALGTIAFPFAAMLWGHPTAGAFLFAAFYCLAKARMPLLAGFLLGWAVLTEYTCAFAIPLFFWHFWNDATWKKRRPEALFRIVIGALPPAMLFAWYHTACFGSPLALAPRFQNPAHNAPHSGPLLFGVLGLPSPVILWRLLVGKSRGLLLISPVLILCAVYFCEWMKEHDSKRDAVVFAGVFLCFLFFNASYNGWHGGRSSGPRYLLPALPFLCALLVRVRWTPTAWALATIGIVNCAAIAAVGTDAEMPKALLWQEIYPRIMSGERAVVFTAILCACASLAFVARKARARART